MDAATITALLSGLGGQITTGINQALVNANNAGREGNGPPGRPPDFSDRHRPDTAAQILKSQQSAFDHHAMENRAQTQILRQSPLSSSRSKRSSLLNIAKMSLNSEAISRTSVNPMI